MDSKDNSDDKEDDFMMEWMEQGNPKGSRKQVAPILLDFVNKYYAERYCGSDSNKSSNL